MMRLINLLLISLLFWGCTNQPDLGIPGQTGALLPDDLTSSQSGFEPSPSDLVSKEPTPAKFASGGGNGTGYSGEETTRICSFGSPQEDVEANVIFKTFGFGNAYKEQVYVVQQAKGGLPIILPWLLVEGSLDGLVYIGPGFQMTVSASSTPIPMGQRLPAVISTTIQNQSIALSGTCVFYIPIEILRQTAAPLALQSTVASSTDIKPTSGNKNVLVVPVSFSDAPTMPRVYWNETMFGSKHSVANLYLNMSNGKLTFAGSVAKTIYFSNPAGSMCNLTGWTNAIVQRLNRVGVAHSDYDFVVFAFGGNTPCPLNGASPIGSRYSYVFYSGDPSVFSQRLVTLIAHEIGHGLGLKHQNLAPSESESKVTDVYGLMEGNGTSLSAPEKTLLGWITENTNLTLGCHTLYGINTNTNFASKEVYIFDDLLIAAYIYEAGGVFGIMARTFIYRQVGSTYSLVSSVGTGETVSVMTSQGRLVSYEQRGHTNNYVDFCASY